MKRIHRILVAVKNPDARRQETVDKAVHIAKLLGASVELFHALSTQAFFEIPQLQGRRIPQLRREATALRTQRMEALAEWVRRSGVKANATVAWDFPVHEAIVRRARRGADLIIAAAHEGKRTGWLMRLPDWELLRHSPIPVLLLKSRRRWRKPTLLTAVDPSHAHAKPSGLDDALVTAGKSLQRQLGGTLELVHANYPAFQGVVIGDPAIGALTLASGYEAQKEIGRRAFEKFAQRHRIPATRRHLVDASPETAIPAAARRLNADIVVMGAVARSGIKRLLIGSTAERVLNELPCDVLVIKPPR